MVKLKHTINWFLSLVIFTCLLACRTKTQENTYTFLEVHRNHYIDTVLWQWTDTALIETDTVFHVSYTEFRRGSEFDFNYTLPKDNKYMVSYGYELADSLMVYYEKEELVIYKYEAGHQIGDGLMFTYFEPSIGILLIKSASWGTYARLIHTGDSKLDKKVFYLNEQVISNESFFNERANYSR